MDNIKQPVYPLNVKIEVECNFPNRFHRELSITTDHTTIRFGEMDSRDDRTKELALDLIYAGTALLNHHELFKGEEANK